MFVIVAQTEIENVIGRCCTIAADRAVIQVASAKDALEIIAQSLSEAAPMVTFVPDREQLNVFLTQMEGWLETNIIVLFGSSGANGKSLDAYCGCNSSTLM